MNTKTEFIYKSTLELAPIERATLINKMISSLDKPDTTIDSIWKKEIENRVIRFEQNNSETVSLESVISKYL